MKVEEYELDREIQPKEEITTTPRSQPRLRDLVCSFLPDMILLWLFFGVGRSGPLSTGVQLVGAAHHQGGGKGRSATRPSQAALCGGTRSDRAKWFFVKKLSRKTNLSLQQRVEFTTAQTCPRDAEQNERTALLAEFLRHSPIPMGLLLCECLPIKQLLGAELERQNDPRVASCDIRSGIPEQLLTICVFASKDLA